MSTFAASAALLPLLGALRFDVATLTTAIADQFSLVVTVGAAASVASTCAVTAASTSAAVDTAAAATSSRVLVAPSISTGVRCLSPIRFGLRSVTLT